jgi:hypothetical protein
MDASTVATALTAFKEKVASLPLPALPALPALPSLDSLPLPAILKTQETQETQKSQEPLENPAAQELPEQPVLRVLYQVWGWIKYIVGIAFWPTIATLLASLIANEMIVYPAPIRLGFFLFTLFLCLTMRPITVLVGFYYLCKWGYDYYVNEMTDGPKRRIMPTTFALLPLTTTKYQSGFLNEILSPFQYGEVWSKADGRELRERMEDYHATLKESFPFLEAIKTQDPFSGQLAKIEGLFTELHKGEAPATSATSAPSAPSAPSDTSNAPLPAIIPPSNVALPPSGPVPATIEPTETS